jgi:HAE1 family hydrophobic/amphiphilic exporter-1/multidrug efflux pump
LWKFTPGSLVPDEDQGFYIGAVFLPDGASLERTDKVVQQVEAAIRANPANQDVVSFTGFDFIGGGFRNNAATLFVTQVPWDQREVTAASLVGELFGRTMGIKEALVLAFNPPAIFGLGTTGGFEFYIQNRGDGGAKRLSEVTQAFLARAHAARGGNAADRRRARRAAVDRRFREVAGRRVEPGNVCRRVLTLR